MGWLDDIKKTAKGAIDANWDYLKGAGYKSVSNYLSGLSTKYRQKSNVAISSGDETAIGLRAKLGNTPGKVTIGMTGVIVIGILAFLIIRGR